MFIRLPFCKEDDRDQLVNLDLVFSIVDACGTDHKESVLNFINGTNWPIQMSLSDVEAVINKKATSPSLKFIGGPPKFDYYGKCINEIGKQGIPEK